MLGDGASFSLMVGLGETYLAAFVLALGLGEVAAGLVTTIPLVCGALLQLSSPYGVRKLRSHRKWVVACAFLQACSFLPLAAAAIAGSIPPVWLFLVAAVYWGAGLATGPAWNTWAGRVVPPEVRASFFARRTRISQAGVLIGFVAGGVGLQAGLAFGKPLLAFAALFAVASACRFLSASFLFRQSEPPFAGQEHRRVSVRELFRRGRRGEGALLSYLLCVQMAVMISGPYFTPYMLRHLKLTYIEFVILIGTSFLAKIVALPALGRFAQRFGARQLLWLGGAGIVPVAGLWLVSQSFVWLVVVQWFGGFAWAAYELAMFLLFFEAIRPEERTSVLTTFNLANSLATAGGSILGGLILAGLGENPHAYLTLFAATTIARLASLIPLARVPASERGGESPEVEGSVSGQGLEECFLALPPGEARPPVLRLSNGLAVMNPSKGDEGSALTVASQA